ncbi:TIGR02265 family protein [Vitiosangium sp. GDMCC 1.1324]|uniref:TIGR02265 family protein n=1 Tax=Vitiosangium sp. (strain GDMCC 1.1324) TaxID=2138576 RepID=UPI00130E73F9|nr:TIGR02265 family protein [Vitiosangium sp. GDMCC 1.1324]
MKNPDVPRGATLTEFEEEQRRRMALLTPADTARGLYLNGVLEVVRELGSETAMRQCLEAAGEKKFVDFFSYSSRAHLALVYTAAKLLHDKYGGFEKTLWHMGYKGTKNFFASAVGKTMLVVAQGSPKRLLTALPAAFSVSVSTLQGEVRWTGPNSATFILKRDFMPLMYTEGALQAVFENAKVQNFQMRSREPEPLVGEYMLSWE